MAVVVHEAGKRAIADGKDQQLRDALAKICMVDLAFIDQAYIEVSSAAVQGKRKKTIEKMCYVARPAARTVSM